MSLTWSLKAFGLGVVALSLSLELLCWLFGRLKHRGTLNKVLIFPSEVACVEHLLRPNSVGLCFCGLPHGVETSFSHLLRYILSASSSLDLCLFSFSNIDLKRAVILLNEKGVTIRVVVDKDYSAITGSQIGCLRKAGIRVRCEADYVHMHHKFAVVDGRLLITGSLNWTLTAVQCNRENVIITEEAELVQPFIKEFERLWVLNDPARVYNNL